MNRDLPLLVVLTALFVCPAHASDAGLSGDQPSNIQTVPAEPLSHRERLKMAVSAYQRGERDAAQLALARLVNDPTVADEQLRQKARVYLGEVLYLQKNEDEARRVFEAVLTLNPSFTIDPFAHPPDVCGFFETVRAYIVTPAPQQRVSSAPPPQSALLGFGVYHIQHGQNVKGFRIAALQVATGALSMLGFAGLMDDREYLGGTDTLSQLRRRRSIQWGATAAFYGTWAWSIADANRHWRANISLHPTGKERPTEQEYGLPTRMHFGLSIPMP